jgi:hypothetical protein
LDCFAQDLQHFAFTIIETHKRGTMNNLIFLLMLSACSTHTPARVHYSDIRETISVEHAGNPVFSDDVPAEALIFAKKINYWVNGKWVGRGKHRHYVAGHWEKRIVIPPSDQGYMWMRGRYTRGPSKEGRPRGWVPGHWEKK